MKLLKIAFLISLAFSVSAQDEIAVGELCSSMSTVAEEVMKSRHAGIPMSQTMELLEHQMGLKDLPGSHKSGVRKIVVAAYEAPRYTTEEHIQRSVTEFSNEIYMQCYKSWTE